MATSGKLEVQIGADITDFEKKIKEVEYDIKELSKVKLEKIKLGLDTTVINAQIKDAKNNLNGLKTAVRDTGGAVAGMAPKVANGSNALMQFSRIAQDAPYGIIGIGNNITATVEAFGHLKNSTGTAGGALKAMASSLMGTGGILLGVSLLTTGFTLLSQSGLSVGDIIDKVTGKFDAFGDSIKKINEESAKTAGKEIAELKALISVAQDETVSREKRLIAVKELQKEFPSYFGNLSEEKILNGDLTKITNTLTDAILARARASAISGKIGELASQRLVLEEKREKSILDIEKARAAASKDRSVYNVKDVFSLKEATDAYKETTKAIKELDAQARKYSERLNKDTATSIDLNAPPIPEIKDGKLEKRPKIKSVIDFEKVDPEKIAAEYKKQFDVISEALGGQAKLQPIDLNIPLTPILDTGFIPAFQLELDALAESINTLIDDYIGPSLASIGTSIGEAIATGANVIGAIGQSLLQSFAGYLSEMGDMLIKYGLLAITKGKIDLAILAGGPVAIGAGIAAIAVGVLLKAASGALGAKAKGGSGGGGVSSSTGNGANNSSTTSGGGYGWSGGGNNTVVFEIAGTSLIGVLNNTTERNLRIGGRS